MKKRDTISTRSPSSCNRTVRRRSSSRGTPCCDASRKRAKHSSTPAPSSGVQFAARAEQAPPLTERPQWRSLQQHYRDIEPQHLRELFASDGERGERFTAEAAGLYLDYSKNRINGETLRLLIELAEACGVS